MKTITITMAILFCFGCATPPTPPNLTQLMLDSMDRVRTGRAGTGPTVDQLNQQFADYDKARAEYEQTITYKALPYLVTPLLLLGSGANGLLYSGIPRYGSYYGFGGYGYSGKPVVTISPTGGCYGY